MKTPAFQFYPGDFLSSPDVQMMTTIEVGAYCLLLFNAWIITDRPGYLPNNERKLQRLTKLSNKEWASSKEVLLEKFISTDDGLFLYNKRLIAEYDKQETRRQRLAENGKKGGRPPKPEQEEGELEKPTDNLQVNSSKPNDKQEQRLSFSSSISSSLEDNISADSGESSAKAETVDSKSVSFETKCTAFVNHFNKLTGKKHRIMPEKAKAQFKARLKEGYTSAHFTEAISAACKTQFHIDNNFADLTPEFITRQDKLEKYLNVNKSKNNTQGGGVKAASIAQLIQQQENSTWR